MEKLVDSREARRILGGISHQTLVRWMKAGYVPYQRISNELRFCPDELRNLRTIGAKEACHLLSVSRSELHRLTITGRIPARQVTRYRSPQWRYIREELEAWIHATRETST